MSDRYLTLSSLGVPTGSSNITGPKLSSWSCPTNLFSYSLSHLSSVQFSCSVVSDSLQPHESQHARPPCPLPTPGVHSDSRPSSQWCHRAISSSVIPFSSCPQSLPASESFLMSQLFAWGSQSTGVSALASVLPKKSQGWSPSEWTGWISLQSKGLSRVFCNTTVQKHQFFRAQLSSQSNSHIHTWQWMAILSFQLLRPTWESPLNILSDIPIPSINKSCWLFLQIIILGPTSPKLPLNWSPCVYPFISSLTQAIFNTAVKEIL